MHALRDELLQLDTSPRALRQFGVLVGGVLLAVAAWGAWRHFAVWPWVVGGLGACLVVLGLGAPGVLRRPYIGWMGLAVGLGFVTSRVLLTGVFVVLVVPVGLALRAFGRAPFPIRPDPAAETYWHARDAGPPDPARFGRYY
jgi:hypothetical protein